MSCEQYYPYPQVFLVDGGGGSQNSAAQPPNLVPCWSFPPAQERLKSREKSRGTMSVSFGTALIVLMLFLLVFAALGLGAYQILSLQKDLKELKMKMKEVKPETEFNLAEKQIGHYDPGLTGEDKDDRPAAHVTGRIEKEKFYNTLRWELHKGRAFASGGVAYRFEDGALQVNETGLYHIYSRVELIFKDCTPKSSFVHTVFTRTAGRPTAVTLMEANRAGFCSQPRGHPWTSESYLGSVLQLQKYDKVFVNVSHPSYLTHAHYANFFGLYKI